MKETVLITGATKGIGRACAEACAAAGKKVIAVARSEADLNEMEDAWDKAYISDLHTFSADLSDQTGCAAVGAFLQASGLEVTALVNNVGQFTPGGLLMEEDILPRLMELNLLAAHRLSRIVLPDMLKRKRGKIITIGSVAATDFPPQMNAYTVSKYALHGWQRALAQELEDSGEQSCLIVPGATLTAAWAGEDYPANRILPAEQVAAAVGYALDAPPGSWVASVTLRPVQHQ